MTSNRRAMPDFWTLAAWACAAPAVLAPVADPDLWWHLSSARWIVANRAAPASDWLSWTLAGAPWTNFEWLGELALYAVARIAGPAGLWLFKVAAVSALVAVVWRGLGRVSPAPQARAAGFSSFAAVMVARGDLRLELFSLCAFAWLLFRLDEGERAGKERGPGIWAVAALFAVWANVHAGFVMGLALAGGHGAVSYFKRKDASGVKLALTAAAATLANPYGLGVYKVLGAHLADSGAIAGLIDEWGGAALAEPSHRPMLFAAGAAVIAAVLRPRRAAQAPLLTAAAFALAAGTLRHMRLAGYAGPACGLYLCHMLAGEFGRRGGRGAVVSRVLVAAFLALAFLGGGRSAFSGVRDLRLSPVRAVEFIARHPELSSLRLYNAWGWGGYLGWRLGDKTPVFQDGRYIFHPLLVEAKAAASSPAAWSEFLRNRDVEAALLQNRGPMLDTVRRYPDGSEAPFRRPYYALYMPKEDWALVYWDAKALLFVRRDIASSGRMPPEYRLLRPGDEAALADALKRGEISPERLEAERRRRLREAASLPETPPAY